jgi:hypothetical protein
MERISRTVMRSVHPPPLLCTARMGHPRKHREWWAVPTLRRAHPTQLAAYCKNGERALYNLGNGGPCPPYAVPTLRSLLRNDGAPATRQLEFKTGPTEQTGE